MKKLCLLALGVSALSVAPAFADAPLCLTINNPGKWGAGLVLQIEPQAEGGNTAYLKSAQMFRGATSESARNFHTLGIVRGVTRRTEGGRLVLEGGAATAKLSASLGDPDQYGEMQGEVDLQLNDLEIHAKSASATRFTGDGKCE